MLDFILSIVQSAAFARLAEAIEAFLFDIILGGVL